MNNRNHVKINYIKYFYIIVILTIFATFLSLFSLYLYKNHMEKSYYKDSIASQEIIYNASVEKYKLITSYIFEREINKPEVLDILEKAINSKDENEKRYLKGIFYQKLYPIYEHLKKEGVRQFHFHTKDNYSFLRFNKPSKFGDNLVNIRKSVQYANETGNKISIFETGKLLSGFRNVFPIIYKGEKLGTVEISLGLKSMINSLEKFDNRKEYLFILNKKQVESKLAKEQKYLYTVSNISSDFLIEDSNNMLLDSPIPLSTSVDKINKKIFLDKKIQESLLNKDFILKIINIDNKIYDIIFFPLIGLENVLDGYLISYTIAQNIPVIITFFPLFVFIILFGMLLSLILLQIIKNKSEELIIEKDWFLNISNTLSEGIYITDADTIITYVNPMACKILGYKKKELIGQNAHYLFHFHNKNDYSYQEDCVILKAIHLKAKYKNENEYFRLKNTSIIPVEVNAKKIFYGQKVEIITTFRDLSLKKELENKANLLNTALDFCSDSIVITDKHAIVKWANPAFEKLTGFNISEIENSNLREFVKSGVQSEKFYQDLWETILDKKPWKGELINKRKDNSLYHEELSITPILNSFDEIKYFIAVKQDITEKKNREKEIEYLAYNDYLTKLPNRKYFNDKFEQILKSLKLEKKYVALLFLDLDKFKILNDTKGHDCGDKLLKEVSLRLTKTIRNSDFVARLGGDEFVIILDNLPNDYLQAKQICEKICEKILENIRKPFLLNDFTYIPSTSMGVYIFNNPLDKIEDIIKKSDLALYDAKKNGRNGYFLYKEE